eukprot:Clim_evm39s172 gene=Clim_evmTU39s172
MPSRTETTAPRSSLSSAASDHERLRHEPYTKGSGVVSMDVFDYTTDSTKEGSKTPASIQHTLSPMSISLQQRTGNCVATTIIHHRSDLAIDDLGSTRKQGSSSSSNDANSEEDSGTTAPESAAEAAAAVAAAAAAAAATTTAPDNQGSMQQFTGASESANKLNHWEKRDPLLWQWLNENYEPCVEANVPRSTIFAHYEEYCKASGTEPVNSATFGKVIRSVFPHLKTRRLGMRGQSRYHYEGIRLKDNPEDFQSQGRATDKRSKKKRVNKEALLPKRRGRPGKEHDPNERSIHEKGWVDEISDGGNAQQITVNDTDVAIGSEIPGHTLSSVALRRLHNARANTASGRAFRGALLPDMARTVDTANGTRMRLSDNQHHLQDAGPPDFTPSRHHGPQQRPSLTEDVTDHDRHANEEANALIEQVDDMGHIKLNLLHLDRDELCLGADEPMLTARSSDFHALQDQFSAVADMNDFGEVDLSTMLGTPREPLTLIDVDSRQGTPRYTPRLNRSASSSTGGAGGDSGHGSREEANDHPATSRSTANSGGGQDSRKGVGGESSFHIDSAEYALDADAAARAAAAVALAIHSPTQTTVDKDPLGAAHTFKYQSAPISGGLHADNRNLTSKSEESTGVSSKLTSLSLAEVELGTSSAERDSCIRGKYNGARWGTNGGPPPAQTLAFGRTLSCPLSVEYGPAATVRSETTPEDCTMETVDSQEELKFERHQSSSSSVSARRSCSVIAKGHSSMANPPSKEEIGRMQEEAQEALRSAKRRVPPAADDLNSRKNVIVGARIVAFHGHNSQQSVSLNAKDNETPPRLHGSQSPRVSRKSQVSNGSALPGQMLDNNESPELSTGNFVRKNANESPVSKLSSTRTLNSSVNRGNVCVGATKGMDRRYSPHGLGTPQMPVMPRIALSWMSEGELQQMDAFTEAYAEFNHHIVNRLMREAYKDVHAAVMSFWTSQSVREASNLLDNDVVIRVLTYYERQLIDLFIRLLVPDILRSIGIRRIQMIRIFARRWEQWNHKAVRHLPARLVRMRILISRQLSHMLHRCTSLMHLVQSVRSLFASEQQVQQMMADLNSVDMRGVLLQAEWTFNCAVPLQQVVMDFRRLLSNRAPIKEWFSWLDYLIMLCCPALKDDDGALGEHQLRLMLLHTSYLCSLIIRDLTLRSANAFGSFHLMRMLVDEYLTYQTELRPIVALQRREAATIEKLLNGDQS